MLTMGVWLRTDSRFRDFISERSDFQICIQMIVLLHSVSLPLLNYACTALHSFRYRQAVGEAFWEAPTLYAFSYVIIVLGCCMIVVSFFGERKSIFNNY